MIDSSTKKQVVAIQENNQIKVKLYSWADMSYLEDHLFEKFEIEIDSFKPIEDENVKEIGSVR